jgi:hypothetical protein
MLAISAVSTAANKGVSLLPTHKQCDKKVLQKTAKI